MTYTQYFEVKKRQVDGQEFSCLTDTAPQDLKDLVRAIHMDHFFGCLPNDWIYGTIHQAFDDLEQNILDDMTIEPDMYNHELYKWLYENGNAFAAIYCDTFSSSDGNHACAMEIINIISGGQQMAKEEIYRAVNDFMEIEKVIKDREAQDGQ